MKISVQREGVLCSIWAVVLGCLAGPAACAQQEVKIAAWNIASGRSSTGGTPIPADRLQRIARVIRQINPHLIVLSEVHLDSAAAELVKLLGTGFQAPVIQPQNPSVVQNLAILGKTGVQITDAHLIDGSDLSEEPSSRKALTVKVRIRNFDFILVGVHLKSGRSNSDRSQRTRQCQVLAKLIASATQGDEKDVLVMGDYNMIPGQDLVNFQAMDPNGFLRFVSTETLQGKASHIQRCNPVEGNLLDGYAISRTHTREFIAGSLRLMRFVDLGMSCGSFAIPASSSYVSDHLPVVARFRVGQKDDD